MFNIIFSIFLSKVIGLSGIALGTILANLINVILLLSILKRRIEFRIEFQIILKLIFFNLILFFTGLKIKETITYFFEVTLFLKIIIFLGVTVLLLLLYLLLIYLFYPYKKFFKNVRVKGKKC